MIRRNSKILVALGILAVILMGLFWLLPEKGDERLARSAPEGLQRESTASEMGVQYGLILKKKTPRQAANAQGKDAPAKTSQRESATKTALAPHRTEPYRAMSAEEQEIAAKLVEQGVSRRNAERLTREDYPIADEVFEHLSKASNWMPELQKAASSIILSRTGEPSMLRIYDVADDSVLREFGIQDGDVIALIDGEIPVFSPSRAVEYTQQAYNVITDLQNGRPVSITVLRNGRPVHLVYQRW